MAERGNTITQHIAKSGVPYIEIETIRISYDYAIAFSRQGYCNGVKFDRADSLLYFSIAFMNKMAYYGLTPDFNETMDKLTWEATERVNE